MPQLPPRLLLPTPRDDFERDEQQGILGFFSKLIDILNTGLRFADNFDAQLKTYTTNAVADTEDTIAHTLKRVPTGAILYRTDKAVSLYDGGTAWTATDIYLKANVATAAVEILIF